MLKFFVSVWNFLSASRKYNISLPKSPLLVGFSSPLLDFPYLSPSLPPPPGMLPCPPPFCCLNQARPIIHLFVSALTCSVGAWNIVSFSAKPPSLVGFCSPSLIFLCHPLPICYSASPCVPPCIFPPISLSKSSLSPLFVCFICSSCFLGGHHLYVNLCLAVRLSVCPKHFAFLRSPKLQ